MGSCGISRMAQVRGYAVELVCEVTQEEPHNWHWDATFMAEWMEPDPDSVKIAVRTSSTEEIV